jgi:predicted nucleic acid-binding protein
LKILYLETSAVLRWLFGEPEASRIASLIEEAEEPVCSALTILEAQRAVIRARTEKTAGVSRYPAVEAILLASAGWTMMEITPEVRSRAAKTFPVEPIRTLDAIHLATALEFSKVFPDLSVLSFDQRILNNLEPLGLLRARTGA